MIGCLEIEVELTVLGFQFFIPIIVATIGLNRGDSALRGRLGLIEFTGEDGLSIASLEDEPELTIRCLLEFKPT